jgi:signal transduction histidine kinase/DNA-binding response OmpR family regulator
VALHGGTIDVDSIPGRGSEFRVRIPLGTAHLPQERVSAEAPAYSVFMNAQAFAAESQRWLPNETGDTGSFASLSNKVSFLEPQASNAPSATVLVVDDNADMRDYVSRLLGTRFVVLTASDGEAALDLIKTGRPLDLVLSDMMMPRLDGAGLLQAIRGNPDTHDLPVILLSARAGEEAKIEGLALGADDYLVKPFSARELLTRIDTHVRLTRLRREAHQRVQTVLNSITDGLFILDRSWCYTYVSDQASRMLNVRPEQMLGECVWDLFPHAKGTRFYEECHRAMKTGQPVHFEEYYPQPLNQWLECHFYPSAEELSVYFRDITKRKEAEQKLRQSQEALQEADRRKDEFLATLAHELRNPLAPIRTAARILGTQGVTQEQLASCAKIIQRQAQSMALLLDDLLDISRISSNKLQLKKQLVTVASVIQSAVETARPLIDARGHALSLNLPDKPLNVDVDPLRLAQVVTNLLTNAAKYTDSNGRIEIAAEQQEDHVEIAVRDNGIGLAAAEVGRVFEMFSQVDGALERAQGGLGIGLALVRGIVELHGGVVLARSEGLGKGSEFSIKLPLAALSEQAKAMAPVANGEPTRHRILVADDNLDARDTLLMLLELSGHEVRGAGNGWEALGVCAAWRPELAILDIGMPELNGYEVAERLRREPWGKAIVLVALTGWGNEKNIIQARAAGFDRHLTKPVDLDNLEKLIAQLLGERSTPPDSGTILL